MSAVRTAVHLLLHQPRLAALVDDPGALAGLSQPGAPLLADLVAWLKDRPDATVGTVLEHWRDSEHADALARLAETEPLVPEGGREAEFRDLMARLSGRSDRARIEARIAELTAQPALDADGKAELKALLAALKT